MIGRLHRWSSRVALVSLALSSSACSDGSAGPPELLRQLSSTSREPVSSPARPRDRPRIYVTNTDAVAVYPARANGNVAPIRTIKGRKTGLKFPHDIALDAVGIVYVTTGTPSVTAYAAQARGDAAPIRQINGPHTGLVNPGGLALDDSGYVYVANGGASGSSPASVTVYAPGADGDVAPTRNISGSKTQLADPFGIALDTSGNIYVASYGTYSNYGSVTVYAAGANGNVAPIRTISGPNTDLSPTGIVVRN